MWRPLNERARRMLVRVRGVRQVVERKYSLEKCYLFIYFSIKILVSLYLSCYLCHIHEQKRVIKMNATFTSNLLSGLIIRLRDVVGSAVGA